MNDITKAERLDSFVNIMSGLGMAAKPSWKLDVASVDPATLTNLYHRNWLARRIVELLPRAAWGCGWTIEGAKDPQQLRERFDAINYTGDRPDGALLTACYLARLYGGAALYLGMTGPTDLEIRPAKGEPIEWLDFVRVIDVQIGAKETVKSSRRYGEPNTLNITRGKLSGLTLHESRLLWCPGDPNLDLDAVAANPIAKWLSVLISTERALANHGITWEAVGALVQRASIQVMKVAGLIDALASEDMQALKDRARLLSLTTAVSNTMFLDSTEGEDLVNVSVSFADIPQLIQQSCLDISGAAGVPASILFGQSAAGLNSTGEGDLNQWAATVQDYAGTVLAPRLEHILSNLEGAPVKVRFAPYRKPTALELETLREKRFKTDQGYWQMGALELPDIIRARSADGTLGVSVNVEEILQALANSKNESSKIEITPSAQEAIVTVNEAREKIGLPTTAGGDISVLKARTNAETIPTDPITGATGTAANP